MSANVHVSSGMKALCAPDARALMAAKKPQCAPWVSTRKTLWRELLADTLVRSMASQMALRAVSHPSDHLKG